jgi:MtN3 and saliva related transmembrane protein
MDFTTVVGLAAAICTTVSYYPQLKKCWDTGSAGDLSLRMFSILAVGIALWVAYGVLKSDYVIVLANSISLCFLGGILYSSFAKRTRELWRHAAAPLASLLNYYAACATGITLSAASRQEDVGRLRLRAPPRW